ncbi:MAG: lipid-A-disaccharide synthase [Saprospiraceae bacterium]|nr:lipid-A-disaccharide synthase [Saprospiraceae bacterium]
MKYYLIAGEASGDIHGANLMKAIKVIDHAADFRFWGGDRMAKIGGKQMMHYRDTAYMGFWEVIKNLSAILQNLKFCKQDIFDYQPDALILIDYPGFNIRIAKWAKSLQLTSKIIYYISPQIWAWKAGRAKVLKKVVDEMLVILPFEPDFYAKYDFQVNYVGHPLLDHISTLERETSLHEKYGLSAKPIVALLPGSRGQEVINHLPVMLSIVPDFPQYQFVIAAVSTLPDTTYEEGRSMSGVRVIVDDVSLILRHSTAALVASGTATLETALMGIPQVVCYRGGWLNYFLAKKLIKVKYISLVNLILDRPMVKELIQDEFNRSTLIKELGQVLDPGHQKILSIGYHALRDKLGNQGASQRAADKIFKSVR